MWRLQRQCNHRGDDAMSREAGKTRMFKGIQKKLSKRLTAKLTPMPKKIKEKFKLRKAVKPPRGKVHNKESRRDQWKEKRKKQ